MQTGLGTGVSIQWPGHVFSAMRAKNAEYAQQPVGRYLCMHEVKSTICDTFRADSQINRKIFMQYVAINLLSQLLCAAAWLIILGTITLFLIE